MTLAIIQARLGSTRFPNKALADICGHSLIERVFDRVLEVDGVDHVVLAVPEGDGWMHAWATEVPGVPAGDVLTRFVMVATRYPDHDTIMRVTGDCPLFDPRQAEKVLALYRSTPACEYAWNVADGYTDGEDCEVFSRAALLQAHWHAQGNDREHVTPWIRRHYVVATLPPEPRRLVRKTSIDTMADLERVRLMLEGVA